MKAGQQGFPLFVVGSGRCGSTVLYSILNAHPLIGLQNEANITAPLLKPDLDHFAVRPRSELIRLVDSCVPQRGRARDFLNRSAVWAELAGRDGSATLRDLLQELLQGPEATPIWGEKTIQLGFALGPLLQVFPDAKIVHIVRDPRDAVLSYYQKRRKDRDLRVPTLELWPLARFYAREWNLTQKAIEACKPAHMLQLRYEDLVQEPEPNVRRICDFLGIEFAPEMLDPSAWSPDLRGTEWHSHARLRQALDASRLGGFAALPAFVLKCIEDHAGLMERYGYARTQRRGLSARQAYYEARYALANAAFRRRSRRRRVSRLMRPVSSSAITIAG